MMLDADVSGFNVVGNWIYYTLYNPEKSSLNKVRTDATSNTKLTDTAGDISVVGDCIFTHGYRIRTDGTGLVKN